MNTRASKISKLNDKKYRDAYVAEYLHTNIAYQIRALRKQRNWDQKQLAAVAGMLQPRISALENPSNSKLNLHTLLRLASAFDLALIMRFATFSDLLNWSETFSPETFEVNSFANDPQLHACTPDVMHIDTSTQQLPVKTFEASNLSALVAVTSFSPFELSEQYQNTLPYISTIPTETAHAIQ